MKVFCVIDPDGNIVSIAGADDSMGKHPRELQLLKAKLSPKFGEMAAQDGWAIITFHKAIEQEPVLLTTIDTPAKKNMHYQIAKYEDNGRILARVRHRQWDEAKSVWGEFYWAQGFQEPWSKREKIANDEFYQDFILTHGKPQPIWPSNHGYIAVSDNQIDWYHLYCSLDRFFNGRSDVLVLFLKGDKTDLRSDDGISMFALHEDTVTLQEDPREYSRWRSHLKCAQCKNKIEE